MSKEEKKELLADMAEKFTGLSEADKSYIVGYMAGKQEERQQWEQKAAQIQEAAVI